MNTSTKYIIVDDDVINNMLSTMTIETAINEVSITAFEDPEAGLDFIKNSFVPDILPTILLLDLNMPTLTGWQFMEAYERFSEEIKNKIHVYILSSSIDDRDKQKAIANKDIKGFISKPLNKNNVWEVSAA